VSVTAGVRPWGSSHRAVVHSRAHSTICRAHPGRFRQRHHRLGLRSCCGGLVVCVAVCVAVVLVTGLSRVPATNRLGPENRRSAQRLWRVHCCEVVHQAHRQGGEHGEKELGRAKEEQGKQAVVAHLPTWRSRRSRRTSAARTRSRQSLRLKRRHQSPGRRRRSRRSPLAQALCQQLAPRPCRPRHPPPCASVQQPAQQRQAAGRLSWRSAEGIQCGLMWGRRQTPSAQHPRDSSHHTEAECVSTS
jgi:hypothetical protein